MQLLHQRRHLKDAWTEQEHCWRPWMALLEDGHAEGVGQLLAQLSKLRFGLALPRLHPLRTRLCRPLRRDGLPSRAPLLVERVEELTPGLGVAWYLFLLLYERFWHYFVLVVTAAPWLHVGPIVPKALVGNVAVSGISLGPPLSRMGEGPPLSG